MYDETESTWRGRGTRPLHGSMDQTNVQHEGEDQEKQRSVEAETTIRFTAAEHDHPQRESKPGGREKTLDDTFAELRTVYCPLLEPSTVYAILADYDLSDPKNIDSARRTLDSLKEEASLSMNDATRRDVSGNNPCLTGFFATPAPNIHATLRVSNLPASTTYQSSAHYSRSLAL